MINKEDYVIIVHGLGYVGIPLAVLFDEAGFEVIGYDASKEKIEMYLSGIDPTLEVGNERIRNSNIQFASSLYDIVYHISKKKIINIICVPTPIQKDKNPDYSIVESCIFELCECRLWDTDDLLILESTVAPGDTRRIVEKVHDELDMDFHTSRGSLSKYNYGFSPERVAPATELKMENIVKVVGGNSSETTDFMHELYSEIINAGVHKAPSIEVAEASKMLENIQRDVNIALMNEYTKVCDNLNIGMYDVLDAASTKFNFLKFEPGLCGGHCIGVDPYFQLGSVDGLELIKTSRDINENVVDRTFEKIQNKLGINTYRKILFLGLTFKEGCPDTRNSKSLELYQKLNKQYNCTVHDPFVKPFDDFEQVLDDTYDTVVISVKHPFYLDKLEALLSVINGRFIFDLKNMYSLTQSQAESFTKITL